MAGGDTIVLTNVENPHALAEPAPTVTVGQCPEATAANCECTGVIYSSTDKMARRSQTPVPPHPPRPLRTISTLSRLPSLGPLPR